MKTAEFRQMVAENFLNALEEEAAGWKRLWNAGESGWPVNAATNKEYSGINMFYLKQIEIKKGYEDNRWCTFHQIRQKGWKLARGSRGEKVEYWAPYDNKDGKYISWAEAAEHADERRISVRPRYYTVFNGSRIEGLKAAEKKGAWHNEIKGDALVEKISENMGIAIAHDGGSQAYYRISEDRIHLPAKEYFHDEYAYASVCLHELSHGTGHESRLARDLMGERAFEELVAEIASCFMSEHIKPLMTEEHFENHKAYIQGWTREIKEKPEYLISAIREASKAANYLEMKGELISQAEYEEKASKGMKIRAGEKEMGGRPQKEPAFIQAELEEERLMKKTMAGERVKGKEI